MTVRAKFKVVRVERTENASSHKDQAGQWVADPPVEMQTIVLSPVYDPTPGSENHAFWQASPSGEIRLGTINPQAWQQFRLGKSYYVDFSEAGD